MLVLVLAVVVLGLDLLLLLLHWLWHLLFLGNTSVPRCRSMTPRSSLCAAARLRHDHRAQRRGTPPRKSIPPRMQGAVVGTAIKGTCGGPFVARGGGEKMLISYNSEYSTSFQPRSPTSRIDRRLLAGRRCSLRTRGHSGLRRTRQGGNPVGPFSLLIELEEL